MQFIKSGETYGEIKAAKFLPNLEIRPMGKGFIYHNQEVTEEKLKAHQEAAKEAWAMLEKEVLSDRWDLVVLDEVNYAIHFGLVSVDKVLDLLKNGLGAYM